MVKKRKTLIEIRLILMNKDGYETIERSGPYGKMQNAYLPKEIKI